MVKPLVSTTVEKLIYLNCKWRMQLAGTVLHYPTRKGILLQVSNSRKSSNQKYQGSIFVSPIQHEYSIAFELPHLSAHTHNTWVIHYYHVRCNFRGTTSVLFETPRTHCETETIIEQTICFSVSNNKLQRLSSSLTMAENTANRNRGKRTSTNCSFNSQYIH